jgi:hypothetical protein
MPKIHPISSLPLACAGLLLSTCGMCEASAQAAPVAADAKPVHAIPWLNDYSYLADPAKRSGAASERWNYIALVDNPAHYLTLGGEIRYYYNDYDHSYIGVRANDANAMLQQRFRAYADWHAGPDFRLFVELGDNREFFEDRPTPPNNNRLELQQAFFDVSFDLGQGNRLTVRPGRFLMPLGDGNLAAVRDGVNTRYQYDGIRAMFSTAGGRKLDLFATHPTAIKDGSSFDDAGNRAVDFSGVYFSTPLPRVPGHNLDVFFYSHGRDVARYQAISADERRYSFGMRGWRKRLPWDYDAEFVYQFGDFGSGGSIDAWGLLFNLGYTLSEVRFGPRLGGAPERLQRRRPSRRRPYRHLRADVPAPADVQRRQLVHDDEPGRPVSERHLRLQPFAEPDGRRRCDVAPEHPRCDLRRSIQRPAGDRVDP